jgi:polysaccharide export outer membrane protein
MPSAIVIVFLSAALSAAQPASPATQSVSPAASTQASASGKQTTAPGSYILGPGDEIVIRAMNAPDINEKPVRLDQNGVINMPMIGRLHAGGLSVEQLEAELVKRLGVTLMQPEVAVSVTQYKSQPISVFGEVASPGVRQLDDGQRLVEILAMAGGVKAEAGPSVLITRRLEYGRIPLPGAADDATGQFSIAELQLKPLIAAKTPEKDIPIKPYDVISVPKASFVFIAGDVTKTGGIPLTEGPTISITEALSISGGVLKTAAPHKAKILRVVDGTSKVDQLPVDVANIMSGKADDIQLHAGDVLLIPGSAAKAATTRAVEAAVAAGTMILTYGIIR